MSWRWTRQRYGVIDGFADPWTTLDAVLAGEPDGVLVGPYFAEQFADTFAASATDIRVTADFVSPVGPELGADVLKEPYAGDSAHFKSIIANAPVP